MLHHEAAKNARPAGVPGLGVLSAEAINLAIDGLDLRIGEPDPDDVVGG